MLRSSFLGPARDLTWRCGPDEKSGDVLHPRSSLLLHHLPMLSVPRICQPQRDIRRYTSNVGSDSRSDGEAVLDVVVVRVFARIGQAPDGVRLERTRP